MAKKVDGSATSNVGAVETPEEAKPREFVDPEATEAPATPPRARAVAGSDAFKGGFKADELQKKFDEMQAKGEPRELEDAPPQEQEAKGTRTLETLARAGRDDTAIGSTPDKAGRSVLGVVNSLPIDGGDGPAPLSAAQQERVDDAVYEIFRTDKGPGGTERPSAEKFVAVLKDLKDPREKQAVVAQFVKEHPNRMAMILEASSQVPDGKEIAAGIGRAFESGLLDRSDVTALVDRRSNLALNPVAVAGALRDGVGSRALLSQVGYDLLVRDARGDTTHDRVRDAARAMGVTFESVLLQPPSPDTAELRALAGASFASPSGDKELRAAYFVANKDEVLKPALAGDKIAKMGSLTRFVSDILLGPDFPGQASAQKALGAEVAKRVGELKSGKVSGAEAVPKSRELGVLIGAIEVGFRESSKTNAAAAQASLGAILVDMVSDKIPLDVRVPGVGSLKGQTAEYVKAKINALGATDSGPFVRALEDLVLQVPEKDSVASQAGRIHDYWESGTLFPSR